MVIQQFDKSNLATLRASINEALAAVAEKHGLTSLRTMGMTYSGTMATIKLEARTGNSAEDPIRKLEAMAFGFKPSVFGAVLTSRGQKFTVRGFARTKLLVDSEDGRAFKFDLNAARPQLVEHLLHNNA